MNRIITVNIVSMIILKGIAFFSSPLFSRLLGTSNYGIFSVYQTWVTVFACAFTLQAAGSFSVARANFALEEQNRYQSSVLSLSIISYAAFSCLVLIFIRPISDLLLVSNTVLVYALLQGIGQYTIEALHSKFTFEFDAHKSFFLSLAYSLCNIGLSLLFISLYSQNDNYMGKILGEMISTLALGLFSYLYIFRRGKTIFNGNYWRFTLPITIPSIFHVLANLILAQSDRVMIQRMVSDSSVGIYSYAVTFAGIIHILFNSLNNSWVPFYYEYSRLKDYDSIKEHAKNYIVLFTVLTCGFMLLMREVFHLYARADYWAGTDYIPIIAFGAYFVFLYSFPVNYEFFHKKTKLIAVGTTLAALFNIILNYFLIKKMGAAGAVIATSVSHFLQFLFHYICARFVIIEEFPYEIRMFLPGIIAVGVVCVATYLLKDLWLVRWGMGALLGIYIVTKIIKRKKIF